MLSKILNKLSLAIESPDIPNLVMHSLNSNLDIYEDFLLRIRLSKKLRRDPFKERINLVVIYLKDKTLNIIERRSSIKGP